jgi:hypothetical protein
MELLQQLNEAKLHRHMSFDGLDISIEVPADGYRRGVNKRTGEQWAIKVPAHYGYIKGTHSPDGEHLDCYVRKNPRKGSKVFVIHQLTVDGSRFDEDKVMLGYSGKNEAIKAFKSVTFKPNVMYGGCTEFDMEHFQLAAYSASSSHAMLTNSDTYSTFKAKGLLNRGIKSPIMVARKVSESLAEGLRGIGAILDRGDLLECLEWGGLEEDIDPEVIVSRAWNHYSQSPHMVQTLGQLSEEDFTEQALNFLMEQDSLLTDVEDEILESTQEPDILDEVLDEVLEPVIENTEIEEYPVMEDKSYVVVIHTQVMENIGTAVNPSWATAGTKVKLVQENFTDFGSARAVAAKVASGEIPVEITEGDYVLGIDVMPTSEYRQFHEDDNAVAEEEAVEEDMTDDVFFAQQIQETQKLAGVHKEALQENHGTPSVHETRARLEALSQAYFEAAEQEEQAEEILESQDEEELWRMVKVCESTLRSNPGFNATQVIKAVAAKKMENVNRWTDIKGKILESYDSLEDFETRSRL